MVYTSFRTRIAQLLVEKELEKAAGLNPIIETPGNRPNTTWRDLISHGGIPEYIHAPEESITSKPVAIIGAGVAGMRVAMHLDRLKIPYEIFEASKRHGGRCFTYHFSKENESGLKHDYYDVGAMRFPDNGAMKRTFELFKELKIEVGGGEGGELIEYKMSAKGNVMMFNDVLKTASEVGKQGIDDFNDTEKNKGIVPDEWVNKEFKKFSGETVYGVEACLAAAFEPFKVLLAQDINTGWKQLMQFDGLSTRAYLLQKYPWSVVQWMETRDTSTGAYDLAFSESVLDSLDFDYPMGFDPPPEVITGPGTANPGQQHAPEVKWYCIDGGTEVLTDAMYATLKTKPLYSHRVTSISMSQDMSATTTMRISVAGHPDISTREYSHVVSTVPFSCLRTMDLNGCALDYKQQMALRCLNYGAGVKVGIKFKTRWWQYDPQFTKQEGGLSTTDRQSRVVVYPSYGLHDNPEDPGVLIAAYNWTQDAFRFGSLVQSKDWSERETPGRDIPDSEEFLLEQVYKDLAALHGQKPEWYAEQTLDYYAYDWYDNQYTMGAFALFGPGQFSNLYPSITMPAACGNLHFGGEAASSHHAWISGALDSAWRCVHEILLKEKSAKHKEFVKIYGESKVYKNEKMAEMQLLRGVYAKELEEAELRKKDVTMVE